MKNVPVGAQGALNHQSRGNESHPLRQRAPEELLRVVESVGRQRPASSGTIPNGALPAPNGTDAGPPPAQISRERLREILQEALDIAEGIDERGDHGGDDSKSGD